MKGITRTELVWVGKYDDEGNLRPVERTILPFQVVETVNESKADREKARLKGRDLFGQAKDDTWRNMLIWGDNKVVMSSRLPRFAGKINLIYIDPPFATGQDFSFRVRVGDEEFVKEPSIIGEKAYRDTWGEGWIPTPTTSRAPNKVLVKVVDMFGNDTTEMGEVVIP